MLRLHSTAQDDPRFVQLAENVIVSCVDMYSPVWFSVMHLDNWFDEKWLGFSGKFLGAVGVWHRTDNLRFPPFIPSRIQKSTGYERKDGGYEGRPAWCHRYQHSGENLHRPFARSSRDSLFFWYSGRSAESGHASLMLYGRKDDENFAWYASFRRADEWSLNKTKDISRREMEHLMLDPVSKG